MENILVANAGSSSVKFQVFGVEDSAKLTRRIKGQVDGIGTRPHLRASGPDGKNLVDREYDSAAVSDVPAALHTAGAWLREELRLEASAVGHRVVHGGPVTAARFHKRAGARLSGAVRFACSAAPAA